MAVTAVSTIPSVPLPGIIRVSFSVSGGGNWVRAWICDAPAGSKYRAQLDTVRGAVASAHGGTALEVWAGDVNDEWAAQFDRGGVYVVKAQEFTRGASTYGGDYSGSPAGAQNETPIGSVATLNLYVAQQVRARFGVPGRGTSDLICTVLNDSIVEVSAADFGARTPRWENHSSVIAESAARAVLGEYTFSGTIASVVGTLATYATTLRTKFDAHRTQGGIHPTNDTVNVVGTQWDAAGNPAAFVACVNKIRDAFYRHLTNDSGGGPGSGDFHQYGGNDVINWTNAPIVGGATDLESAVTTLAGVILMYESHRLSSGAGSGHTTADTTNAVGATSTWIAAQMAYIGMLSTIVPYLTPQTIQSAAAFAVSHGYRVERS